MSLRRPSFLSLLPAALALVVIAAFTPARGATASAALAPEFGDLFRVVMIDDATEAALGAPPYERTVLAKAIQACAAQGARAVVLRLSPEGPADDLVGENALIDALRKIPVALPARLADNGTTNPIAARFATGYRLRAAVSGERAFVPPSRVMDAATAVGFIDVETTHLPLVVIYRGFSYKSHVVSALELAFDDSARFGKERVTIGTLVVPVDRDYVCRAPVASAAPAPSLSFLDLLKEKLALDALKGRVVILGRDSTATPKNAAGLSSDALFLRHVATALAAAKLPPKTP